jgi:hypothetical protein
VKRKNGKKTLREKKVEDQHEVDDPGGGVFTNEALGALTFTGVENNQTGNPIMRPGRVKVAM